MDVMAMSIFENEQFGQVRGMMIDDEPWFVGKDVASALGYGNTRQAIATNVDKEDRGVHSVDSPSGVQEMTIINESGMYSLIFGSKLEKAKEFKHWVTSEVLPSIRKDGGYIRPEKREEKEKSAEDYFFEVVQSAMSMNRLMVETQEVTENVRLAMSSNLDFAKFIYSTLGHEDKVVPMAELSKEPASVPAQILTPYTTTGDAYRDALVNAAKKKWTTTDIAKDYTMSPRDFNAMLRGYGIQHKEGKVWRLNDEYKGKGYDAYADVWAEGFDPSIMFWTKEGRLFLYDYLKERGKQPTSGPIVEDVA
ncbi:MAG: phage antirepressor [Candidatus Gastranaerophilales bacterium]|nr:phage antirepressor [Candidatus Gastranaerophilales bacterium]